MKKETILKTALIALPVLALGLAAAVDSVTVFDTQSGETILGSYFSLLPVGPVQILPPLAGILCAVLGVCAIVVVAGGKTGWLHAVRLLAFAGCFAAVIPILLRGTTLVIPNFGVPLFLMGEWIVARLLEPRQAVPGKKK